MGELAQKLKELRDKRGLTQKELAKRTGITHSHLEKIEQGTRWEKRANLAILERLAEALAEPPQTKDEVFQQLRAAFQSQLSKDQATEAQVRESRVPDNTTIQERQPIEEGMAEALGTVFKYDNFFVQLIKSRHYLLEWGKGRLQLLRFNAIKAISQLESVVVQASQNGSEEQYALILIDMANAYTIAGEPEKADLYAQQATSILQAIQRQGLLTGNRLRGIEVALARALIMQQEVAFLRGDEKCCWDLHDKAESYLHSPSANDADHLGWAKSLFYLAWMRFHQQAWLDAENYARQAVERSSNLPFWAWWQVRDGAFLGITWWRLINCSLLLDILACSGKVASRLFQQNLRAYPPLKLLTSWVQDLPPFRRRYAWVDEAQTTLPEREAMRYEGQCRQWVEKSKALGCKHLQTEILISFGDLLKWAHPDQLTEANDKYQQAQTLAQRNGYRLLEQIAKERQQTGSLPFPGLTRS